MPTIPSYGQPKVGPAPLPTIRQQPENIFPVLGSPVQAQAVGHVVSHFSDLELKRQKEADALVYSQERRALNDWEIANIHDPKTGAKSRMGQNAFGLGTSVSQSFDEFVKTRQKNLVNDHQRMAYQEMVDSRRQQLVEWADGHERHQIDVVRKAEYGAAIDSSKMRAAASGEPVDADLESMMIAANVAERAIAEGWGPEAVKAEMAIHESELQYGVIAKMLVDGRYMDAEKHFNRVQGLLTPAVKQTLDKAITGQKFDGESRRLAAEALSPNVVFDKDPGVQAVSLVDKTLKEAQAEIDKIQDEKLKAKVRSLVETEITNRKQERVQAHDITLHEAIKTVETTGSVDAIKSDPRIWIDTLTDTDRTRLENRAKRLATGQDVKTDPIKYAEFYSLTDQELAKMDEGAFLEWGDHLSKTDLKAAAKHWGLAKKPEDYKSWFSDNELVLKAMAGASIGGVRERDTMKDVNKSKTKSLAYKEFNQRVSNAKDAFYAKKKRNPDDKELESIIGQLAMEDIKITGYVGGWDYATKDFTRRMTDLSEEDLAKFSFDIQPDELDRIYKLALTAGIGRGTAADGAALYEAMPEKVNRAYIAMRQQKPIEEIQAILSAP